MNATQQTTRTQSQATRRLKQSLSPYGIREALLLALLGSAAFAGVVSGRFVTPLGGGLAHGTLSFALSQAAVESGVVGVVPQLVSCYTASGGSVVGAPDPQVAPVANALLTGTLPAGTYYVVITYTGASFTETLASPELAFTLSAPGTLLIVSPVLQPPAATGFNVYIGASPGAETKQGTGVLGYNYTQSGPLSLGSAPPGSNNTVCSIQFNDLLLPTYTYYTVTVSDAEGNVIAGFPQNWYLSGVAVDVSTITPIGSNPAVRFPFPILANWTTGSAQSIDSALNMNSHPVQQASNIGPGFFNGYWLGNLPSVGAALAQWTPDVAVTLTRVNINAQSAGAGGALGTSLVVTDGVNNCTFSGLLVVGAVYTTQPIAVGHCSFNGNVLLTVKVGADDHTTPPANLNWSLEMTSQ